MKVSLIDTTYCKMNEMTKYSFYHHLVVYEHQKIQKD